MRKIRIGYLADGGDAGGARTHILSLLKNLPRDKFEIYFFALGSGALSHSIEKMENINLTIYPLKSKLNLNVFKEIKRWALNANLHILHTHGLKANMYGRIALYRSPITIITTYHSNPLYDYDSLLKGIIFACIDQFTLSRTDYFVAVSYEIANLLEKRVIKRDKITIIKNGVDLESLIDDSTIEQAKQIRENLNIKDNAKVIGSLGRLVKVKGYKYMIDCIRDLRENFNTDAYLLLIGGGEEEDNLKNYAKKIGVSDYIKFAGFQKNPLPYILATDLMFFTPKAEALGIAVLESMRAKRAVVSKSVGGIREIIIDNYNGYIKDSKSDLLKAVSSLLNDEKKKEIFTKTGIKTVLRFFTTEKMLDKTILLYKSLIEERIDINGIPLDNLQRIDALKKAEGFFKEEKCSQIVTLNIEMITRALKNNELKEAINKSELVLPDGISVLLLGRGLGKYVPERIAGIEFAEELLKISVEKNLKVYFLGGKEEVSQTISSSIKKVYPTLNIAGAHNGYFTEAEELGVIEEINNSRADILFVGLGAGKQEIFINKHKEELKPKIAIGIGGSLDVWAGKVKRAPSIFIKLNIEWLYRVLSQPRERLKRLLSTIPTFYKILKSEKKNKKNILISGYYGYSNIGDEAILTTLIRDIRNILGSEDYNISVLSANPHATSTLNDGVFAIQRFDIFSVLREISRANFVISGGGGLIQDVTSWKSPLYYLGIIGIAKLLNKKVLIYANGVGPLKYKFNRFLSRLILNKVDKITVRDEDSLKFLNKIGVKNVQLTVDPIFSFEANEFSSCPPHSQRNNSSFEPNSSLQPQKGSLMSFPKSSKENPFSCHSRDFSCHSSNLSCDSSDFLVIPGDSLCLSSDFNAIQSDLSGHPTDFSYHSRDSFCHSSNSFCHSYDSLCHSRESGNPERFDLVNIDPYSELNDFIAISLGFSKETVNLIDNFSKLFDYVTEQTGKICLFTPFYYLKDYEFSSKIATKMKNKSYILETILLPSEMLSLLKRAYLGIGMRLHFIIFLAINEKPTLPFLYDPKVKVYSQILNLNCALKGNMNLDEMKKEFDKFYSTNNTTNMQLTEKVKELKEKNSLNVETLKAFLQNA